MGAAALIFHLGACRIRDDIKGASWSREGLETDVVSVTLSNLFNLECPHLKRMKATVYPSRRLLGS